MVSLANNCTTCRQEEAQLMASVATLRASNARLREQAQHEERRASQPISSRVMAVRIRPLTYEVRQGERWKHYNRGSDKGKMYQNANAHKKSAVSYLFSSAGTSLLNKKFQYHPEG